MHDIALMTGSSDAMTTYTKHVAHSTATLFLMYIYQSIGTIGFPQPFRKRLFVTDRKRHSARANSGRATNLASSRHTHTSCRSESSNYKLGQFRQPSSWLAGKTIVFSAPPEVTDSLQPDIIWCVFFSYHLVQCLGGEVGRSQQYCKAKPTLDKAGASSSTSSPVKNKFNIEGGTWPPYQILS